MTRTSLLNGTFDDYTFERTVETAVDLLRSGRRGWICTVNVAILMQMRSDPELDAYAHEAAIAVADGQPLIWASRLRGARLPERVPGIELVGALCEQSIQHGHGVYFLGARQEILARAVEALCSRHPGLDVRGQHCGYFEDDEAEGIADRIRESGAAILFVGMGVPRQERFIRQHWARLGVSTAIGVGGSFDVFAGARRRAPRWMQNIGCEWVFRMMQEPLRLGPRYFVTNLQFAGCLVADLFRPSRAHVRDLS